MPCQEYTVKTEFAVLCGRVNNSVDEFSKLTSTVLSKIIADNTPLLLLEIKNHLI
jgi:hypothetical protein